VDIYEYGALLFGVGVVLHDPITGEIGLLMERVNLLEDSEYPAVRAWRILWAGSNIQKNLLHREQIYTEEGLKNMVRAGALILLKNI